MSDLPTDAPIHGELFFVLCPSFHGATLLSLLLNNHSQISALGDTFPRRDFDEICSCEKQVSECLFWQEILEGIEVEEGSPSSHRLPDFPEFSRSRSVNRAVSAGFALGAKCFGSRLWKIHESPLRDYLDRYLSFRNRVLSLHSTSCWIDGNKQLLRPFIVSTSPNLPFRCRIIHLLRDPRAFVFSNYRNKAEGGRAAAVLWRRYHRLIEFLYGGGSYLQLRYEDLCDDPQGEMEKVFAFIGLSSENVVSAPTTPEKHHLLGNKMLRTFSGDVRLAESWREGLSADEQEMILRVGGRVAEKAGYRS